MADISDVVSLYIEGGGYPIRILECIQHSQ